MLGLAAICALLLSRREVRNRLLRTNRRSPGESETGRDDPEALLVKDCQAFEQWVREIPGDASAWSDWGKALAALAAKKSGDEADRLYAQADEKYSAALAIAPNDMVVTSRLVMALWSRAVRKGGDDGRQLLIRACGLCERMAGYPERDPKRARVVRSIAFYDWGEVLTGLGRIAGHDEADRFYAEAEEKYSAALAADPDHKASAFRRAGSLWSRAIQRPGEAGRQLLLQARDAYAELVRKNPEDAGGLAGLGGSLILLGVRAPDVEADRLYVQAEEKLRLGLAANPADESLLFYLASAMTQRALMHEDERGNEIIKGVRQWVEAALRAHPTYYYLLRIWGHVLKLRAERMPGAETGSLIGQAVLLFDEAAQKVGDPNMILGGWGSLLFAQAWLAEGAESVRLLEEARKKFAESESRAPGSAAYDLACVAARLGEPDECRRWLETSRDPGIWTSADGMARDPSLASVCECEWFRQLLAK
jgi:tetratricopeptide (TPR) repeat protein